MSESGHIVPFKFSMRAQSISHPLGIVVVFPHTSEGTRDE